MAFVRQQMITEKKFQILLNLLPEIAAIFWYVYNIIFSSQPKKKHPHSQATFKLYEEETNSGSSPL
jgi:hypothetical protein